jgi:hypothetical protein
METPDPRVINDIKDKVKEYAELSKSIKVTQQKVKLLNTRKKELYQELIPKLKNTNIQKCNLNFGTLKVVESKRKVVPNRTNIKEHYINFFNSRVLEQDYVTGSPEQKATILFDFIYKDSVEYKNEKSINILYSKEFKDQLKELSLQ